ncbi:MAG: HIT domain-containing protein [Nitrospirae bacterium]|nr:HIT domain-containing protein [Nitrospirota bacterium]MCL5236257.1 HIT domain-containing protein [Nitrospirota bacterium]
MKVIWAPWRMEYILSEKEKDCLFCAKPGEDRDRDNLILCRGRHAYVIMNKYPYNNGHLMAVPYFHTSSFDGLSDDVLLELMKLARYSVDCLKRVFNPEGFNIGSNIGEVAGAGIKEHLHIHIVPRWAGDANFMAVVGEVRVIPEHILETYDKLRPVFSP